MATERFFCDSCGDQILNEEDVIRIYGHDCCENCYHDGMDEEPEDFYDDEQSYDLDCGFDPYMGSYTDDC